MENPWFILRGAARYAFCDEGARRLHEASYTRCACMSSASLSSSCDYGRRSRSVVVITRARSLRGRGLESGGRVDVHICYTYSCLSWTTLVTEYLRLPGQRPVLHQPGAVLSRGYADTQLGSPWAIAALLTSSREVWVESDSAAQGRHSDEEIVI